MITMARSKLFAALAPADTAGRKKSRSKSRSKSRKSRSN